MGLGLYSLIKFGTPSVPHTNRRLTRQYGLEYEVGFRNQIIRNAIVF